MSNHIEKRFGFIAGVVIILRQNDKVLLVRRQNTGWMDGYYSFIGGGIDGGETIIQAAVREAHEELGIQIAPENLRLVHVMHGRHKDASEGFSFLLEACSWAGEAKIMEPHKADDLIWVDINSLPEQTIHVRKPLEHIDHGIFYSDFGWE